MAHEQPSWEYGDRLLRCEKAIRDYRRRFWLALAGYILLAIGLVIAVVFIVRQADNLEDTQRGTIELVRCADHPKAPDCDLDRTYKQLLEELE